MSNHFPVQTEKTAQVAYAMFDREDEYLKIGDHLELLFRGVDFRCLYDPGALSPDLISMFALITLFQAKENLTDEQAVEAIRTRTDWKYALHLPMDYLGLNPALLCDFRRRLIGDQNGQQILGCLIQNLADLHIFHSGALSVSVTVAVDRLCKLNALDLVLKTMQSAVEMLAAEYPDYLREIALPHWYVRYGQTPPAFRLLDVEQLDTVAQAVGVDGQYLLDTVKRAQSVGLANKRELHALRRVWCTQFETDQGQIKWRSGGCIDCQIHHSMDYPGVHYYAFSQRISE